MKLTKLTTAAAAVALAAAFGTSAHAQYHTGDLLIGFEQAGAANNYVVDLGSAAQFIGATSNLTFNLSTDAADLGSFTNWSSNSQTNLVQWGVVGTSNKTTSLTLGTDVLPASTLFYTVAENPVGTQSTPPTEGSLAAQKSINGQIATFANTFNTSNTTTGSSVSLPAITQSTASGWSSFSPNLTAFGIGSGIEQGTFTGPTNSVLDLYELVPNSSSAPATLLGSFSLASNGVLTFDAASVPEPSSYALMGLGAVALLWHLRRKNASAL